MVRDDLASPQADFLAQPSRNGNDKTSDEKDGHNDECKNPLEGDNLGLELCHTEGSAEDAEGKSQRVILEKGGSIWIFFFFGGSRERVAWRVKGTPALDFVTTKKKKRGRN